MHSLLHVCILYTHSFKSLVEIYFRIYTPHIPYRLVFYFYIHHFKSSSTIEIDTDCNSSTHGSTVTPHTSFLPLRVLYTSARTSLHGQCWCRPAVAPHWCRCPQSLAARLRRRRGTVDVAAAERWRDPERPQRCYGSSPMPRCHRAWHSRDEIWRNDRIKACKHEPDIRTAKWIMITKSIYGSLWIDDEYPILTASRVITRLPDKDKLWPLLNQVPSWGWKQTSVNQSIRSSEMRATL